MTSETQQLLAFLFQQEEKRLIEVDQPKVNLRATLGLFAFVYERARNLVDYQEEHLLLRRAITRILVRRAKLGQKPTEMATGLVNELLMARYLPNDFLAKGKLEQTKELLERYFLLYQTMGPQKLVNKEGRLDFLLSLAAREVEELYLPVNDDQLVDFALAKTEKRLIWAEPGQEGTQRTRLLVGLQRALAKYDDRTIYYKLWRRYFPFWPTANEEQVKQVAGDFVATDQTINRFLNEKVGEPLLRLLRRQIAPFEILKDLINRDYLKVVEIFSSADNLRQAAFSAAGQRYQRALVSLRRSAVNSFVYIFITKMLLALAIEIPYEAVWLGRVNYLPIGVNLLLPPALMLFMALTVESPSESNTRKIVSEIESMVFGENGLEVIRADFNRRSSVFLTGLFGLLYFLSFVLAFGLTVYLLRRLSFSLVSLAIFFFFLSTIAFFAFRIRASFKELVVGEERQNLISALFEFFMLPFIKLGRMISNSLTNLNVFLFVFDVIIEAPFKLVLEVIEEGLGFLREKKEEALNVIK